MAQIETDKPEKWLILFSIGDGPRDGEAHIYNGTVAQMQQYMSDINVQGAMSAPLSMVLQAVNKHMLTLEKLGLTKGGL